MDTEQIEKLANAVNNLQWWALGILLLAFITWRIFNYLDKRDARRAKAESEAAKSERAQIYASGWQHLAASFDEHTNRSGVVLEKVASSLRHLTDEQRELMQKVEHVARKTRGVMSVDNSLTIIETYYSHIVNNSIRIVAQSLQENDYVNRAEYIARKIRSKLAEHIQFAREQLRSIHTLALDADRFFLTYVNQDETDQGGERFQLCDAIWTAVEPCYEIRVMATDREAVARDLSQRTEEAKLLIKNAIQDHYTHIANRLRQESVQAWNLGSSEYRRRDTAKEASGTISAYDFD